MHLSIKKTALWIMASVFVPTQALAQSATDTEEDTVMAAQAVADGHEAAQVEDNTEVQMASDAETSADAEPETPTVTETTDFEQQIRSQKSEKEARKDAMRNMSEAFPADGDASLPASAQTSPPSSEPVYLPPTQRTTERMPRFEHHGYFRTRLSYFGNYDLDTRGTSPVAVPLNSSQRGSSQQEHIKMDGSDAHLGANMRFRYAPTIHITESIRIAGSFDIMDNFVLGTTPNGLRTNWGSNAFFSFDGAEPVNGRTFAINALAVKALYGEADTIIGTFRAGRIPAHWGLGLVYNDGGVYKRETQMLEGRGWTCLDCDSSDAIDRVEYRIRDPFTDSFYLQFSWDFVNSGLASYNLQQDSFGQAFDLAESDDVLQFTLALFNRPMSQQELDERYRALYNKREWTLDWGVLFSYREQKQAPEIGTQTTGDGASATYTLYEKGAKAYVFDLWGRFMLPLPHDIMLRLEAEFVGVVGSVELDRDHEGESRDILQFGMGLEAEVWWRDLIAGIKTGFAWADNMVFSGHSIIEQLVEVPMGSIMRFDPNYRIDQIMFRELMGGINNAWYFAMHGEYKFPLELSQMTMALGARLDMSTAVALNAAATPGESYWYGFEAGLKLFYEESDRFRFEIGTGVFVPGNVWKRTPQSVYPILPSQSVYEDSTSDTYSPKVAWNVLANLFFMF